ncbi:MAG: DNA internalization-related competence protein ComEC/Rec2 [Desulfobacteraceae bacterium]|nr:DNA internalization-related competence protein ComEC/Rec2 [Desulfobacteraceae bacterium]MCF8093863.1 DNA internalization-related competence protein ComEC/Rec2 [Desulfobacteraceae bacterium]
MAAAAENQNRDSRKEPCSFYHRPLLPLLIAYIAGILPARYLPFYTPVHVIAWAVLAAAGIRLVFLLVRAKPALISPMVLFFTLGFLALSPWHPPYFPPENVSSYLDSGNVQISGTIAAPAEVESYRTNCLLENPTISLKKGDVKPLPGRIRGIFYGDCPELEPGDRVTVKGGLRSFQNFSNPGGFDYRQFMADRNIWGCLYSDKHNVKKSERPSDKLGIAHKVHRFRNRLDAAIGHAADGDSAAVLSALVIGERGGIDQDLRKAFARAGVSHLLAISGLHVGIVAACAFLLFKLLLLRSRSLLLRGWAVRGAAVLTVLPVVAYGMISGMSPSTQRAMIMVLVFFAAFVLEKPYNPVNILAAAALCILAVYPPGLFSISFQLSFAAVSAIFFGLYLFYATSFLKEKHHHQTARLRLLKRGTVFILVSAFAIAGTMPLVMHYFNQASFMGIISNLLLVPWIGFAVITAGLMSSLVFVFSQTAGTWFLSVTDQILQPAISVIYAIADLPFSSFYTVTPTALEVACIYALMICIGLLACKSRGRYRKFTAAAACVVLLVITADAGYWIHRRILHRDLRITVLDVGRGHASLLELPGGKTVLIDGGGFSDNSVFDVGAYIVAPFLWQNKIRTIDTVILSHPDADHLNGLLFIMRHFRVRKVISTHQKAESDNYSRFLQIIKDKQIPHPPFKNTARTQLVNEVKIGILHPGAEPRKTSANFAGANNYSIVLRVQYRGKSVLFPGDIEKRAESEIVSTHATRAASDILIAPHHGSKSSSSKNFINTVDPDTVIISARKSRLGPPSQEIIDRYKQMDCRILRTDKNGAVRIIVDREGTMKITPTIGNKGIRR